jgi:hypothetical protein
MLENITNKVVTSLSNNILSTSSFALQESSEQTSDDRQTSSSDYLHAKEERTLLDEDKGLERNLFKERPDELAAGHRMISYPNYGQAFHPNFDTVV